MDSSDGVSTNPQRGPFIGRPMPRFEDLRLVRGAGRYTDDVAVAGAGSSRVRARAACPCVDRIDRHLGRARASRRAGGAHRRRLRRRRSSRHGALSQSRRCHRRQHSDLRAHGRSEKFSTSCNCRSRPAAVRYVGEAVAIVVAESLVAARDAAEKVVVDYEILPAVSDVAEALSARGADDLAGRTRQSCARQRVRRSAPPSRPRSRAPTSSSSRPSATSAPRARSWSRARPSAATTKPRASTS